MVMWLLKLVMLLGMPAETVRVTVACTTWLAFSTVFSLFQVMVMY